SGQDVGDGCVIGDADAGTAQEAASAAELVKPSVPTQGPSAVQRQIVAGGIGCQHPGVGKRFTVIHRERVAVEEVSGGRHNFISEQRVEVTSDDGQIAVGNFRVQLGHRPSVVPVVPAVQVIPVSGI